MLINLDISTFLFNFVRQQPLKEDFLKSYTVLALQNYQATILTKNRP